MSTLKKQSKNILTKINFGEEDLQRGSTKMRSASVSAPYIPVLESLFYWNILWLSWQGLNFYVELLVMKSKGFQSTSIRWNPKRQVNVLSWNAWLMQIFNLTYLAIFIMPVEKCEMKGSFCNLTWDQCLVFLIALWPSDHKVQLLTQKCAHK